MDEKPKITLKLNLKKIERFVCINLDDKTDTEEECADSDGDIFLSAESLQLSSELSQCSDLNKNDTELELDLIEEVIFQEDTTHLDQYIDKDNVDENGVEEIKSFLLSDCTNWEPSKSRSKHNKSKKSRDSKKKIIKELKEENLKLYDTIDKLNKQLEQKKNRIQELTQNHSKFFCKCGSQQELISF